MGNYNCRWTEEAILFGNIVKNNYGGGIAIYGSGKASLFGNIVENNYGTGIRIRNSQAFLSNNVIQENVGSGIYIDAGANHLLAKNFILDNSGYGIQIENFEYAFRNTITFNNNIIVRNPIRFHSSSYDFPRMSMSHNTIVGSQDTAEDKPMVYLIGVEVDIQNTIVSSTTVGIEAGYATVTLRNTLWYNNETPFVGDIQHSGSFSGDPDFINPAKDDYHIGPNSAAIGRGIDVGVQTDIDGQPRVSGKAPDVGADEFVPCYVHLNGTDYYTLQAAIQASTSVHDVIKIAGTCYEFNIALDKTLTLRGGYSAGEWLTHDPYQYPTTIDALGYGRVFTISGGEPRIENLNIVGGNVSGPGGGIYIANSTPVIRNVLLLNNRATYGGGLAVENAHILLDGVILGNNWASSWGAGLYLTATTATVVHTTIANNDGAFSDAVYVTGRSTLSMLNTIIAGQSGGIPVDLGSQVSLSTILWPNRQSPKCVGMGSCQIENPKYGAPKFVAPEVGNYHLDAGSAAIDTGIEMQNSTLLLGQTDIDGDARPLDGNRDGIARPDIGADEWRMPWLLLFYLNGDNNLDKEVATIKGHLSNGSRYAYIIILEDIEHEGNSKLYEITPTETKSLDAPWCVQPNCEVNMGSRTTLENFINWSRERYGEQHYRYTFLSIVNHGGGWSPTIDTNQGRDHWMAGGYRGLSVDETDRYDTISTREQGEAFRNVTRNGQSPLDVVFLDACNMNMIETAYEVHPSIHYLVGGENLFWTSAFTSYQDYLISLDWGTDPRTLATTIVENYMPAPDKAYQISALDLQQTAQVSETADALALLLIDAIEQNHSTIQQVYTDTQKFDALNDPDFEDDGVARISSTEPYVDLYDLAVQLVHHFRGSEISQAAYRLMDAMGRSEAPYVVTEVRRSNANNSLENAHGVSIYMPFGKPDMLDNGDGWLINYLEYYNTSHLRWARDTHWDEFLMTFYNFTPSPHTIYLPLVLKQ